MTPTPDALSRHWIVWREIESEEKNKSGREGEEKKENGIITPSLQALSIFLLLTSLFTILAICQKQAQLTSALRKILIPISIILAS